MSQPQERRFRRRPEVVDAYQWHGAIDLRTAPEWVRDGVRAGTIWFAGHGNKVHLAFRMVDGSTHFMKAGNWLVRFSGGRLRYKFADQFAREFEEAD